MHVETFCLFFPQEIDASNKTTEGALTSLSLAEYNESGETPAKRDRRSLQKPLTIMNESQILGEYEQPSFNTTIDEEDLPVTDSITKLVFNIDFSRRKVFLPNQKKKRTPKTSSKTQWPLNADRT